MLVGVADAARLVRVPRRTLYRWVQCGLLTDHGNGRVLVDLDSAAWLAEVRGDGRRLPQVVARHRRVVHW